MKALVLGGSGFIGSHLVNRLLAEKYEVAVLDVVQSAATEVEDFVGQFEDRELLSRAIAGCDIVFHLVSTTVPATSNENIEFDIASNLISLVRLLEVMRSKQVGRIVYLSSGGAVYGNPLEYPIREDHPLQPISSYGIVKSCAEKYLYLFQELYGFEPLIIRPANAYGPGQNIVKPQGVIGHFLANALRDLPLQIWGDGSVRRDYIFVEDLVDLIMLGVARGVSGVFNAGAGKDVSLLEIVQAIQTLLGKPLAVDFMEARSCDVNKVRLDITKARQVFGWQPRVELLDGIEQQLHSLQSRF